MQRKAGKAAEPGTVAKVPVMMQMDALECGAVCLNMVLAYYGRFVSPSRIRKECGVSRDGSSFKSMKAVAESYGLVAEAYMPDVNQLREKVQCPCILLWENRHYVLLCGYRNGTFFINDPAYGAVRLSGEEFEKRYSGICMVFLPTSDFEPGGKNEDLTGFIKESLKGTFSLAALILITSLILTLAGIIEPFFSRFFIDYLLPGRVSEAWNTLFFGGFLFLLAVRAVVLLIRSMYLFRIKGKISLYASTTFLWRIIRLPLDFFSQRYPSDIINRIKSNDQISAAIVETFVPAVLDAAAMFFYLAMMLSYSPLMAFLGVLSVIAGIAVSAMSAKRRENLSRIHMKSSAELSNCEVSSVKMLETIKAAGAEDAVFGKWSGLYAEVNHDSVLTDRLLAASEIVPDLLSAFSGSLILCMGVGAVMKGDWTIGLVSAFTAYLSAFSGPARAMTGLTESWQQTRMSAERIADVMNYETAVPETETVPAGKKLETLTGLLEIRNLTFGYNRALKPVIDNFSLTVRPGQSIALVGSSGCGKSTLAKLAIGSYSPWSGEVLYDGRPVNEIERVVFSSSVSFVDQSIALFSDSVLNNITMWDPGITYTEAVRAAKDACIYEDIMQCEYGFLTQLLENGRNFSGGQRQRIEIARALACQPRILFLDEATSALDAETEENIIKALKERDLTTIFISHRLSAIRDCDLIIVFKDGRELDRGTHGELMERCGYYSSMITNE